MTQSQVAPAEAPYGFPAPTSGSDSNTSFKIMQISYVHLVSTQMFTLILTEKCGATAL